MTSPEHVSADVPVPSPRRLTRLREFGQRRRGACLVTDKHGDILERIGEIWRKVQRHDKVMNRREISNRFAMLHYLIRDPRRNAPNRAKGCRGSVIEVHQEAMIRPS